MSYIGSAEKGLERVIVTKRRVPAAVLEPSPADAMAVERLQGFLRGSVVVPPEIDLTAPVMEEAFAADEHREGLVDARDRLSSPVNLAKTPRTG